MNEWGPLAALAGTWEGNDGLDVSYHNVRGAVGETGYFEKVDLKPFGPVENGKQSLYGLDYRMAAWRHGEEDQNPFHTEVGYWLWDAADGQVMRCFMVPRGAVLIAGTACAPDAKTFTMQADPGVASYGILENAYLASRASTRGAGSSSQRAALSTLTYGFSNSPSSNFARSTRATALSMTEVAIALLRNAFRNAGCCAYPD